MALRKYKCEKVTTDSNNTSALKKVIAELKLVDGPGTDELRVFNLGAPVNGATGTIWVEITNPAANPFTVGREYTLGFTEL